MRSLWLALATLAVLAAGQAHADDLDVTLGSSWRFVKGDPAGAQAVAFDTSSWSVVKVPHTWNQNDWQEPAGYYRGPAWYRTEFEVPAAEVSLPWRHSGVRRNPVVYLSGPRLAPG